MNRPSASYFIITASDKPEKLERFQKLLYANDEFEGMLDCESEENDYREYNLVRGSCDQIDSLDDIFKRLTRLVPGVDVIVTENCEELYFNPRELRFSSGELKIQHEGHVVDETMAYDPLTISVVLDILKTAPHGEEVSKYLREHLNALDARHQAEMNI